MNETKKVKKTEEKNYFKELCEIDVSEYLEKKGNYNYLSWPDAVRLLGLKHPMATWEIFEFDGAPFSVTSCGYFVKVAVTIEGVTKPQWHPVLDHRNNPIQKPNAFQINTAIQRCLTKAIAIQGLGLYVYAGEDLPPNNSDGVYVAENNPDEHAEHNKPKVEMASDSQKEHIKKLIDATDTPKEEIRRFLDANASTAEFKKLTFNDAHILIEELKRRFEIIIAERNNAKNQEQQGCTNVDEKGGI